MMDRYMLMLYVSLEQERGLKQFFCDNGWTFCKTDLSKTTDKVGPLIPDIPQDSPVVSDVPSTPSVKKLKKTGVQRKIVAAKQTSLPLSESEVPVESVKLQENLDGTESVNDTVETIGDDADDSTVMDATDTYSENMEDERAEEEEEEEKEEKKLLKRETANCRKSGRVRRMSSKLRENLEDNGGIGLKRSWRIVKTEPIFSCKDCDLDFDDDLKLGEHLDEVHWVKVKEETLDATSSPVGTGTGSEVKRRRIVPRDPNTETKCGLCENIFPHKDLGDHYKTEHNVSIKYVTCPDGFSRRRFSCDQCCMVIGKVPKLLNHIKSVHGLNGEPPTGRPMPVLKKPVVRRPKTTHMCLACDETFVSLSAVKDHQKQAHGLGRNNSAHVPGKERLHICETCGKVYRRSDYLKYHIDVAHLGIKRSNNKPLPESARCVCDVCGASFARKGSLIEHLHSVHSQGPFEHQCDQCPMSFTRKGRLEHHMNKCHLNTKPFRCDKCQVTFYSSRALHQHKILCNMDDTEKLKCKECGHLVASQHNLDMHIQAMHRDPALSCPCGTVVRWRSSIAKHKRRCRLNKFRHAEHNFAAENGEVEEGDPSGDIYEEMQENDDPSGDIYEEMQEEGDPSGDIYEEAEAKVDDAGVEAVEEVVDNPWGNEVLDKSENMQTHVEEVSEEHVEIIVKEASELTDPNLAGVIDPEVVAAVEQVVEDGTLDLGGTGEVVFETNNTLTVQQVSQGNQKLYYIINYTK